MIWVLDGFRKISKIILIMRFVSKNSIALAIEENDLAMVRRIKVTVPLIGGHSDEMLFSVDLSLVSQFENLPE